MALPNRPGGVGPQPTQRSFRQQYVWLVHEADGRASEALAAAVPRPTAVTAHRKRPRQCLSKSGTGPPRALHMHIAGMARGCARPGSADRERVNDNDEDERPLAGKRQTRERPANQASVGHTEEFHSRSCARLDLSGRRNSSKGSASALQRLCVCLRSTSENYTRRGMYKPHARQAHWACWRCPFGSSSGTCRPRGCAGSPRRTWKPFRAWMDERGQLSFGTANVGRARLAWAALRRTGPCGGEVNVAPKDAIAAQ